MIRVYLSGAMRGRPLYNFPLFQHWAYRLRKQGFEVHSPADADLALGFDPTLPMEDQEPAELFTAEAFIRRDVDAVLNADVLALLPDTAGSIGTAAEIAIARWADKVIDSVSNLEAMGAWAMLDSSLDGRRAVITEGAE